MCVCQDNVSGTEKVVHRVIQHAAFLTIISDDVSTFFGSQVMCCQETQNCCTLLPHMLCLHGTTLSYLNIT